MANKRSQEIAVKAQVEGVTPLEVLLSVMRAAQEAGNAREAAFYANMAAPYMHARLSAVQANVEGNIKAQIKVVSEFDDLVGQ
jgi:hypothetical protein